VLGHSRSTQMLGSASTIHVGIREDLETCSVSSLTLNTDFRFNGNCGLGADEGLCRLDDIEEMGCQLDELDDGPGSNYPATPAAVVEGDETTETTRARSPMAQFLLKKLQISGK